MAQRWRAVAGLSARAWMGMARAMQDAIVVPSRTRQSWRPPGTRRLSAGGCRVPCSYLPPFTAIHTLFRRWSAGVDPHCPEA